MRNLRQFTVTFATYCSQLVKMVSEPEEWYAFASYLEDIKVLQSSFHSSELIHIPRTHNSRADSLARSARKQPSFVVHMDAEPVWFTESIWVCFFVDKKKKKTILSLFYHSRDIFWVVHYNLKLKNVRKNLHIEKQIFESSVSRLIIFSKSDFDKKNKPFMYKNIITRHVILKLFKSKWKMKTLWGKKNRRETRQIIN